MQDNRHRLLLIYTILVFSLIAFISYWQLSQTYDASPSPASEMDTDIDIRLNSIF